MFKNDFHSISTKYEYGNVKHSPINSNFIVFDKDRNLIYGSTVIELDITAYSLKDSITIVKIGYLIEKLKLKITSDLNKRIIGSDNYMFYCNNYITLKGNKKN